MTFNTTAECETEILTRIYRKLSDVLEVPGPVLFDLDFRCTILSVNRIVTLSTLQCAYLCLQTDIRSKIHIL